MFPALCRTRRASAAEARNPATPRKLRSLLSSGLEQAKHQRDAERVCLPARLVILVFPPFRIGLGDLLAGRASTDVLAGRGLVEQPREPIPAAVLGFRRRFMPSRVESPQQVPSLVCRAHKDPVRLFAS